MSKIDRQTVLKIASLSKIKLSEEQVEYFQNELQNIVAFADKLNELDLGEALPTTHAVPMENVYRQDQLRASFSRDELLSQAPQEDGMCYIVPKVVE